jgi:hypothetical protein
MMTRPSDRLQDKEGVSIDANQSLWALAGSSISDRRNR